MNKLFGTAAVAIAVLATPVASAADRTITLAVQNMTCADCPFIVKKSLERVRGVASVTVSYREKTAVVTYDDSRTNIETLTAATSNAGYPSAPKS